MPEHGNDRRAAAFRRRSARDMAMSDMTTETEQRIRERAYAIWEAEGRPEGRADAH